jgi:peptide-methionine (R)-S-oxide reductase
MGPCGAGEPRRTNRDVSGGVDGWAACGDDQAKERDAMNRATLKARAKLRGIGAQLRRRLDGPAAWAGLAGAALLGASVFAGFGVSACSPNAESASTAKAPTQMDPIVGAATPGTVNENNSASGAAPGAMSGASSTGGGDMTGTGANGTGANGNDAKGQAAASNPGWSNLPVDAAGKVTLSEDDWRSRLSPTQYAILREKGTDRAYSGTMWKTNEPGEYRCAACGNLLFVGDSKFISDCGWPAFEKAIKGSIAYHEDNTYGMRRVEVTCAKCDGHLGHVFDDGPTATGTRYCINQTSVTFIPQSEVKTTTVPEQEAKVRP